MTQSWLKTAAFPLQLLGTTENFHYWKDSSGKVFCSGSPRADDPNYKGPYGLQFFIESVEDFNKERTYGTRFSTYIPSKG